MTSVRLRSAIAILPALVTLLVITLTLTSARTLRVANSWVDHTREVIEQTDALMLQVATSETGQRGFIVTGDTTFLKSGAGSEGRAARALSMLEQLTSDNAHQKPRLEALGRELALRYSFLERGAALRKSGHLDSLTDGNLFHQGEQHMQRLRELVAEVNGEEVQLLAVRQAVAARQLNVARAIVLVGGATAVVVAILVNVFLTRIIRERELMTRELGAQLEDLAVVRRELAERPSGRA